MANVEVKTAPADGLTLPLDYAAIERIRGLGYDTSKLRMVPQSGTQ